MFLLFYEFSLLISKHYSIPQILRSIPSLKRTAWFYFLWMHILPIFGAFLIDNIGIISFLFFNVKK